MTWSDEVPTEPGQYFAMYPGCDKAEPLILTPAGAFFVVGNDSPVDMEIAPYCGTRFCRIPTPEELEDTAYVLSRLIEEVIDAGWHPSHVEDAVEIVKRIRKGGAT